MRHSNLSRVSNQDENAATLDQLSKVASGTSMSKAKLRAIGRLGFSRRKLAQPDLPIQINREQPRIRGFCLIDSAIDSAVTADE